MDNHEKKDEWSVPSESSNIKDPVYNSRVSNIVGRAHSISTLQLIAGLCQIFLGVTVVTVSVLGFINPLWLSTLLTMFGSVTTIVGIGFLYTTIHRSYDSRALIRNAMRRVMESKN